MTNLDSEHFIMRMDVFSGPKKAIKDLIKTHINYEKHMGAIYGEKNSEWPIMSGYHNSLFFLLDQSKSTNDAYELLDKAINGKYSEKECESIISEFKGHASKFPKKGNKDYSPLN